jgi:hypothetical protein
MEIKFTKEEVENIQTKIQWIVYMIIFYGGMLLITMIICVIKMFKSEKEKGKTPQKCPV